MQFCKLKPRVLFYRDHTKFSKNDDDIPVKILKENVNFFAEHFLLF